MAPRPRPRHDRATDERCRQAAGRTVGDRSMNPRGLPARGVWSRPGRSWSLAMNPHAGRAVSLLRFASVMPTPDTRSFSGTCLTVVEGAECPRSPPRRRAGGRCCRDLDRWPGGRQRSQLGTAANDARGRPSIAGPGGRRCAARPASTGRCCAGCCSAPVRIVIEGSRTLIVKIRGPLARQLPAGTASCARSREGEPRTGRCGRRLRQTPGSPCYPASVT